MGKIWCLISKEKRQQLRHPSGTFSFAFLLFDIDHNTAMHQTVTNYYLRGQRQATLLRCNSENTVLKLPLGKHILTLLQLYKHGDFSCTMLVFFDH